jgi:uncharacterized membrane protein YqjE
MTSTEAQLPTLGRLARRTFSTVLGALENRAELFALEFEEENNRLLKVVMLGVGGLFLAMMTVLLVTALIIFLVPEDYRRWAALGFAVLYGGGAAGCIFGLKALLKKTPFSESLNQIKKDSELLDALK